MPSRPATLGNDGHSLLDWRFDQASHPRHIAIVGAGIYPGGDYALAVFKRAEAIRPGANQILTGKMLSLHAQQ